MAERAAAEDPAQPVCASADLAERGDAVVFDVQEYGRAVRAFVLRIDGRVVGYLNRCTHVPTELDWQPGRFLDAQARHIVCSMHGATFDPRDGRCIGGPGRGPLTPLAVIERDGQVYWYPSRDIRPVSFDEPPSPPGAPGSTP